MSKIPQMLPATKTLIPAAAVVFILFACQNRDQYNDKFNQHLIETFNESNTLIIRSTSLLFKSMEDMSVDPVKTERATPWFNKAVKIDEYTGALYRFIDSTVKNNTTNRGIEAVFKKIAAYKTAVFQTDIEIAETFANHFNFINPVFYLCGWDTILNKPLKNHIISKEEIVLLLESLKNKAMNMENKLVSFCFQKVPSYDDGFDVYSMIAGQNANILSPGSVLELKAGIGAFSKAAIPVITFGGDTVSINEEGYAVYRRKVPATPGHYKIPIRVSFYNLLFGKEEIKEVVAEYKVVKTCD